MELTLCACFLLLQFPYRGSTLLKGLMPTRVVLVESTWRQDCDGTFVILFSNHHQTSQYVHFLLSFYLSLSLSLLIRSKK